MSRYHRENPDLPVQHCCFDGVGVVFVKAVVDKAASAVAILVESPVSESKSAVSRAVSKEGA